MRPSLRLAFQRADRPIDRLQRAYSRIFGGNLLDPDTWLLYRVYRGRVKKAIAEAAHAIEAMAAEAAAVGEFADGMMLKQIAERTRSSPAYVDHNFGNAAIRLMERFGLADPDVMAQFLAGEDGNVAEGRRKWSERLSDCRGITMHGGYFDLRGGTHDSQFLWQTAQHLLDILLRIVLKALQYGGTYQPSAARDLSPQPLDWVGPQTPPRTLGYR